MLIFGHSKALNSTTKPPNMSLVAQRQVVQPETGFFKRLNLRNVTSLKLMWFKYELLTPKNKKDRANRAVLLLFVQGVVKY